MKRLITALIAALAVPALASAQAAQTKWTSVTPTVDTSAYASGDVIGGKLTFTNALPNGSGILVSSVISDRDGQGVDLSLVLFESDPSTSTLTDQAAPTIANVDLPKILAVIPFGSSSRTTLGAKGVKYVGSLANSLRALQASSTAPSTMIVGKTLYGVLVSGGAPTFTNASSITVRLAIVSD